MKRGFTLIELLAVMVILAMIALIATPLILNSINDSKVEVERQSVNAMMRASVVYFDSQSLTDTPASGDIFDDVVGTVEGLRPDEGEIYVTDRENLSFALLYGTNCYIKTKSDETYTLVKDSSITTCVLPEEPEPEPPVEPPAPIIVTNHIQTASDSTSIFGYEKGAVRTVTFVDNNEVPAGATKVKDISEKGDGSIMLWYLNGNDAYIGSSDGVVALAPNSSYFFSGMNSLVSVDLRHVDTSNVTNMEGMFKDCTNLASLDLTSFNTENLEDSSGMYENCSNLVHLDLSSFDTSKVTDMSNMFYRCSNLGSLDLSSFDTSHVTDFTNMFAESSNINKIYTDPSTFVVNESLNPASNNMFQNCSGLVGGNGTTYSWSHNSDISYAVVDTDSTPGYFSEKE